MRSLLLCLSLAFFVGSAGCRKSDPAPPAVLGNDSQPEDDLPADISEDEAVRFVEKLGGRVYRDGQGPDTQAVDVFLVGTRETDEALRYLARMNGLQNVVLEFDRVTGKGLKHLARLMHFRGRVPARRG